MPFQDRSFDIVICTEVLEHLEKPDAALKELIRIAKKFVFCYSSAGAMVLSWKFACIKKCEKIR